MVSLLSSGGVWWRSVVGSGLAAGAVRWRVRSSLRSWSGAVVVVGFPSFAAASAFACSWAGRCGFSSCAILRRSSRGSRVWAVSVPVAWPGVSRVA